MVVGRVFRSLFRGKLAVKLPGGYAFKYQKSKDSLWNKTWKGSMAIDTASSLGSWLISVSSERWIPNQTSGACSVPGTLPPTAAWQGHGNSHCFPYGRDGHQPHNRGFVGPHYKDSPLKVGWVYPRCKEFRPWHIWKIVWVQPSAVSIDVNMWFIKYIIFRG